MTVVRTSITPERSGGSAPAVKHLLADRSVQLEAAWLLVQWAAQALDPSTLPGPTPQRPPGPS
jgi:alkylation response protein AidB-like acyl-CoA dehydrogenase